MNVYFSTRKYEKLCGSDAKMRSEWGETVARRIRNRLMELRAADCLDDIGRLPPARCHELTGDLAGHLAVDVSRNQRLIFAPEEPPPRKPDGGLDWSQVTEIVILKVADYH